MSTEIWGLLAKSATDSETIEDAIIRLIAAHNDDETAHLEVGQSLQSHKASEIIDHLALSIVADKIADGQVDFAKLSSDSLMLISCFESLDGWQYDMDGSGGKILSTFYTKIYSGSVNGNWTSYWIPGASGYPICDFSKKMLFQTTLRLGSSSSQEMYLQCGIGKWFGFHIVNGNLYANVYNGSTETEVQISGITLTDDHVYRVIFDPSVPAFYYYVDGILKATISTGLPTGNAYDGPFYYIKTSSNAQRYFIVHDVLFSRDR